MSQDNNGEHGSTNHDEEPDFEKELEGIEDPKVLKEIALKKHNFGKQSIARAKTAEAEVKTLKGKITPKEENNGEGASHNSKPAITAETVDERVLQAQGVPQEDIDFLKKIAAINGTSIIDAQKDELYVARKAKKKEDDDAAKARLGTSRGSGSKEEKKGLNTPGLSPKEHKELWKEGQK